MPCRAVPRNKRRRHVHRFCSNRSSCEAGVTVTPSLAGPHIMELHHGTSILKLSHWSPASKAFPKSCCQKTMHTNVFISTQFHLLCSSVSLAALEARLRKSPIPSVRPFHALHLGVGPCRPPCQIHGVPGPESVADLPGPLHILPVGVPPRWQTTLVLVAFIFTR